jgi:hypothetical protein
MANTLIKRFILGSMILLTLAVNVNATGENISSVIYSELKANNQVNMPSQEVFAIAYKGHEALKQTSGTVKKDILTVIDFSLTSCNRRLWIIDLESKQVLFHDYVAHGRNSGENEAGIFSNTSGSYMSSIGFYVTGETYQGKHGLSMFLEGMDTEFNSNARNRAIVMHGADYVSSDFIKKYGRLGRSLGCPSVSMEIHQQVIDTIKDGSTLLIYYPDPQFLEKSQILNPVNA